MTYFTRDQWTDRPPKATTPMRVDAVEGIALHWPGMSGRLHPAEVKGALRSWQRLHMDTKGWNDIAYQEAVDTAGNVYELRGLRHQSAANGDGDTNTRFGALLLVLGPGEEPTDAMVQATRRRIQAHRELYGANNVVVPHSRVRPDGTECPGDQVRAAIQAGKFAPRPGDEPKPKVTRVGAAKLALLEELDEWLGKIPADREQAVEVLREAMRLITDSMPDS